MREKGRQSRGSQKRLWRGWEIWGVGGEKPADDRKMRLGSDVRVRTGFCPWKVSYVKMAGSILTEITLPHMFVIQQEKNGRNRIAKSLPKKNPMTSDVLRKSSSNSPHDRNTRSNPHHLDNGVDPRC